MTVWRQSDVVTTVWTLSCCSKTWCVLCVPAVGLKIGINSFAVSFHVQPPYVIVWFARDFNDHTPEKVCIYAYTFQYVYHGFLPWQLITLAGRRFCFMKCVHPFDLMLLRRKKILLNSSMAYTKFTKLVGTARKARAYKYCYSGQVPHKCFILVEWTASCRKESRPDWLRAKCSPDKLVFLERYLGVCDNLYG